jgi:hypothetical protein
MSGVDHGVIVPDGVACLGTTLKSVRQFQLSDRRLASGAPDKKLTAIGVP